MPSVVTCSCGKRVRFPDTAAGHRAKCPACGGVLMVPAQPPDEDLYELDVPETAAPDASPDAPVKPAPAVPDTPLWRAVTQGALRRSAAAKSGPRPLFNMMGIEVTRTRLAVAVILTLLVLGIPTWFFTLGPGVDARIVSVRIVQAVPLLQGVQTMPGRTFSVGGGDELFLTRPDPEGDDLLIDASISHALMRQVQRVSQYKAHINVSDFALAPLKSEPGDDIPGRLLKARFDEHVELDLAGPNAMGYEVLKPSGVQPTLERLERGHGGGAASGLVRYDAVNQTSGEFRFLSVYFASGAPGARGLSADGNITRFLSDGAKVEYRYNGGTLDVGWEKAPHRAGWVTQGGFKNADTFNPYQHVRVTLLFPRPAGDTPMRLTYCGKTIGTIHPARGATAAQADARETDAKASRPSAFAQGGQGGVQDPLTGYLKVLGDARKKARGVVAMSNMQQIGIAIGMYAEQQGGRMPESMYDLRTVVPGIEAAFLNQRTRENPGFIYERPAEFFDQIQNPARTPILWESDRGQKAQNGSVLYADGHIESPLIP